MQDLAGAFGWNGEKPKAALKVGSGQPFREIYTAAFKSKYFMVGGTNPGVGGGGGWLYGGGISFTSRHLGLGIDNVLEFEVVLPNGTFARADACTNTDLFWALRGGGGATVGVVTSATYKLWEDKPIQDLNLAHLGAVCAMMPEVRRLTIEQMVGGAAGSTDHNFTMCGTPGTGLPADDAVWVAELKNTTQPLSCGKKKFAHLCGEWADFVIHKIYKGIDDRWGNNAIDTIQFRGTLADARSSFIDSVDKFWEFDGAPMLLDAFGPTLKYAVWYSPCLP